MKCLCFVFAVPGTNYKSTGRAHKYGIARTPNTRRNSKQRMADDACESKIMQKFINVVDELSWSEQQVVSASTFESPSEQCVFLSCIPDVVLYDVVIGPHLIVPAATEPELATFRDTNGNMSHFDGVYHTSKITNLNQTSSIKHFSRISNRYVLNTAPTYEYKRQRAADAPLDTSKQIGYFSNLDDIKRSNASVLVVCMVCKDWHFAFKKHLYHIDVSIERFCEDTSMVQHLPMFAHVQTLPTVRKKCLVTMSFNASRVAFTPTGEPRREFIPLSCILANQCDTIRLQVVSCDGSYKRNVSFSKRIKRSCNCTGRFFADHRLSALSESLAKLHDYGFRYSATQLKPVIFSSGRTFDQQTLQIQIPVTSMDAFNAMQRGGSTDSMRKNNSSLTPLRIEATFGNMYGSTQPSDVSAIVHSMPFYVLSEKATHREAAAIKRRERTKRESDLRGTKKPKSERMIVVE